MSVSHRSQHQGAGGPLAPRRFGLRRHAAWLLPILLAAALEGCAGSVPPPGSAVTHVGFASYYGREFAGRRTASGERYDPHRLTAAHRSLPFGTRLLVTNLDNGRSVVVRVNDRGPQRRDRILDVSSRAAERLGFASAGLARVRIDPL
jgi:rare lipoprotein A